MTNDYQEWQREFAKRLGDTASAPFREAAARLSETISASVRERLPSTIFRSLPIDYEALGFGLPDLSAHYSRKFGKSLKTFQGTISSAIQRDSEQWQRALKNVRKRVDRMVFPNWRGIRFPGRKAIETLVLDEGIPVAWVPRPSTLQELFEAADADSRVKAIGRRRRSILTDCSRVLDGLGHEALDEYADFAEEAIEVLRAGYPAASQALCANLLDTILRRKFAATSRREITTNKKGDTFDLDEYTFRVALTLAPIWRAYAEYWEDKGDPIPVRFGRHPSAHAVVRSQYSRANAVIALMLVTSLLALLDIELLR